LMADAAAGASCRIVGDRDLGRCEQFQRSQRLADALGLVPTLTCGQCVAKLHAKYRTRH
jgi:hypothetical protein